MNIKRAFLAAVAVLMVPGFAMAQSTHTFSTSLDVAGGGTHDELNVTITCNGGLPLTQSAMTPVTFTVTELAADAVCNIVVDDSASAGWMMVDGGCPFDPVGDTLAHDCMIELQPVASTFSTTVMWDIAEEADPGVGENAMLTQVCMDVWNGTTYTTTGQGPIAAGPGATFPISLAATPGPDGSTNCYATLSHFGSAVEVDQSGCADVDMPVNSAPSCTIYASAFYEGIPTLSQYGMAIMALLMLGVGFVGFRRFV